MCAIVWALVCQMCSTYRYDQKTLSAAIQQEWMHVETSHDTPNQTQNHVQSLLEKPPASLRVPSKGSELAPRPELAPPPPELGKRSQTLSELRGGFDVTMYRNMYRQIESIRRSIRHLDDGFIEITWNRRGFGYFHFRYLLDADINIVIHSAHPAEGVRAEVVLCMLFEKGISETSDRSWTTLKNLDRVLIGSGTDMSDDDAPISKYMKTIKAEPLNRDWLRTEDGYAVQSLFLVMKNRFGLTVRGPLLESPEVLGNKMKRNGDKNWFVAKWET